MISKNFDFDEFVGVAKGLDRRSIIDVARKEKREVMTSRNVGRYGEILNGLAWLLEEGTKPNGVHPWEFAKMRPIIEDLVERKELPPDALSVFGSED